MRNVIASFLTCQKTLISSVSSLNRIFLSQPLHISHLLSLLRVSLILVLVQDP